MKNLLSAGMVGAAIAAFIISPAMAQDNTVPVDPQGFSPYNTHGTLTEHIDSSTIRNAPSLGLSAIYGLNPCSLGASAGVTTPLFGVAGAISTTDKDCEIRNTAALTITGLKDEAAAREIMCDVEQFRAAVKRLGKPCLVDQPRTVASHEQPNAVPVVAQQAAPAVVPIVATKPAIAANSPTFCQTPGLMLGPYPECTEPTTKSPAASNQPHGVKQPIVRAAAKKDPAKAEPEAKPEAQPLRNLKLEPIASQAPNMMATLQQRRAAMLAANDTTAVRLIDERIAAEKTAVAPQAAPSPGVAKQSDGMMATMMQRGAAMVAANDLVAARLYYQRAAEAGISQAASEIAKTYDPRLHPMSANAALADDWYRRARTMADADAMTAARLAAR